MTQLKKCLYLIDLLKRRGALSLGEINGCFKRSSLYDREITPRTFARYKDYIASNFPYYIEFDARTRKYVLMSDEPLYGEDYSLYNYLLSAYHVETLTELALKHKDKMIVTEMPTGVENVYTVLEAIDQQKGLECDYYSFNRKTLKNQTLIPYFLKTWERRWYLVAEPLNEHHGLAIYALERMENVELTKTVMLPSNEITPAEYFNGSYGVNHSDNQRPETVRVKVYDTQVDYVRSVPIHESQKEIETTPAWSIFEYSIVPCFNLYQQLLWHREKLEILEPAHVREEMKEAIKKMLELY